MSDTQDTVPWILKAMPMRETKCQETLPILLRSRGSKLPQDHLAGQRQSRNETPGHRGPESTHLTFVLCSPRLPEPLTQASRAGPGKALSSAAPGTAGALLCSGPRDLGVGISEEEPRTWDSALRFKAHICHSSAPGAHKFWLAESSKKDPPCVGTVHCAGEHTEDGS